MSGEGIIPHATEIAPAKQRTLRQAGIALEVAASALNAIAPRVEAGQSSLVDFENAVEVHSFARDEFREALHRETELSAATIERGLAL